MIRVTSYCEDVLSAETKSQKFKVIIGDTDMTMVHEEIDIMPPMPKNISAIKKIKEKFIVLNEAEISLLSSDEKKAYLIQLKDIEIYDNFISYILTKKCFNHSSAGARFSFALDLKRVTTVPVGVISNQEQKWKMDIYEASIAATLEDVQANQNLPRKYILVGPCPETSDNQSCLDYH